MNLESIQSAKMIGRKEVNERMMGIQWQRNFPTGKLIFILSDMKGLPWDKLIGGTLWAIFGMNHKQHVRKTGAKICAISVVVTGRFRIVHVDTFRTIDFNHCLAGNIRQS